MSKVRNQFSNKLGRGMLLACLGAAGAVQAQADMAGAPTVLAVAPARPPETAEQLERRLASVGMLIESSSAARQIDASGLAKALALRTSARELHLQAKQAQQGGQGARAGQLLEQASKTMFLAVREAAPEQLGQAKLRRDFDQRMESVNALLGAQQRISAEKHKGADAELETLRKKAAALAAAGKLDEGKALLDQVYQKTRGSIESMRNGDTLVRSLNFATKEEEYHYEVDRNDTHAMLIKVLLDEKRSSNASLDGMVKKYLDQAAALRGQAEARAAAKDFEGGVKLLEDATRELVRAIRGAGVYIPG
jgi:hypothetical protein